MHAIIGGTGTIGRHVVAELVARGEDVRVLTRDAARARTALGAGPELVVGDLAQDGVARTLLDGASTVFLATPGTPDQPALETGVLDAVAASGGAHVVKVSVIGAAPDHPVRFARWHAEVEAHLSRLGLPATVLRPSWFHDNFLGSAPTVAGHGAVYGSAGDGRVGFVDARDIAAVAVVALLDRQHAGREHVVTGPSALTFAEAAQQLSAGLGRQVSYVDLGDAELEQALVDASLPADVASDVVSINVNARRGGLHVATTTVQELTGRPPRDLAAWARDHAAAFAPAA